MFEKARIRLTFQYVLLIMLVSILFSAAVYRILTFEIRRSFKARPRSGEVFRVPSADGDTILFFNPFSQSPSISASDLNLYEDIKHRLLVQLIFVNTGVFTFSAIAAYLLAGRTLRPIENMVDEQKRFIADASHELRTPLTALKTEIEVALRDKKLGVTDAKKLLASNLEEVDKINALASYLLTLNTYQNKKSLTFTTVSLPKIIRSAIKNVDQQAQKRQIKIIEEVPDLPLHAHGLSLIELVTILLDNAIKYSHPKGRVLLRAFKEGKHVRLEVKDFGMGIKASDIPYIFNRFYRADSSRNKDTVDGYGLGLSIAKDIVALHMGSIEVESKPGSGTTFIVRI